MHRYSLVIHNLRCRMQRTGIENGPSGSLSGSQPACCSSQHVRMTAGMGETGGCWRNATASSTADFAIYYNSWLIESLHWCPRTLLLDAGALAYHFTLPMTNFDMRCTSWTDSSYQCVTYDSYINNPGGDARFEDWTTCSVTDPALPRPLNCVCGQVCATSDCAYSSSHGHVRTSACH